MRVNDLCEKLGWELVHGDGEREITGGIYCCDLLSIVMGRAPSDSLWITVMGNVNAMAVAALADTACVAVAENMLIDDEAIAGAKKGNVTVIRTGLPVFESAMAAARLLGLN
ncbi:MAG: hypothetical protein GXY01_09635 [Clostridiales bacterium]|jgi:hypothetical protein|nr:hypothetical protein [Clostridiales bacterium]